MTKAVIHHVPSESPLAFKAAYADFKLVKTRKTAQFVFEVPIEGADAALKALGGVPQPDCETWVAVARLDPALAASERNAPVETPAPTNEDIRDIRENRRVEASRQRFSTMPLAKQAALRCNDPNFRRFLGERAFGGPGGDVLVDVDAAADEVREICGVTSRSMISIAGESGRKWLALDAEYNDWKHAVPSYEGVATR